ncbi:hypothetical protein C2I06_10335 [Niallia circulans]|uniref:Uncharacterized protein n=1 Tax=Niallia circulans TaxID=1397 RepID=A0A268F5J6_NIACI|nr:hypothetical protein [Niallia circulans]AYV67242.1 hypothetical protein C2I06_10335 [Niallia circulans]AYV74487.1 hypothetical protein C2H98_24590 [Niallia circulans]PAD80632.1 hypothetical protein CHH57_24015 [Niallia circulans]UQZ76696.1 hypothetical protein C2I17_20300 [Niallia circulans]
MTNLGNTLKLGATVFSIGFGFLLILLKLLDYYKYKIYGQWLSNASYEQIDAVFAASGIHDMIFKCSIVLGIVGIIISFSTISQVNSKSR